ncbi:DUF58 domain-containing protein [Alkalicoccobacillus murimartini]|uniref:Uncharacterized protein (DUF58 family) n=1 Tax=Alkalicoccobacillus murimartini TaxID=171685 RepID=A0ABT9YLW2_9BACI|nr:DUF58 domain-containing protein [Alkalicoccobacillus murimartini]MDQ0208470.1 uncharacterized protein (DUF58 family) [Alkalicoccobacillus murimartini]
MRNSFRFLIPMMKGLAGLLILGGCFAYAMFQGGFVSWFLFYSVLMVGLFIMVSVLFTIRFSPERVIKQKTLYAGEHVEVEVVLRKKVFQPFIYLRIKDLAPSQVGSVSGEEAMFFFSFSKQLSFRYDIHSLKRGIHTLEKMEITTSDFFGWFERVHTIHVPTKMTVFPRYKQLGDISTLQSPQHISGLTAKPSFREEDRSLAGVRNYVPGDRMTSINWKQSARRKELMTKEFETHEGQATILAFDAYASKKSYEEFERVVEQVASITSTFLQSQVECQLAVHFQDWVVEDIQAHSWEKNLTLLATVEANKECAPSIHPMYRQWKNRTVFYICAQLDERVFKTLEGLVLENARVKVCLLEMEPDQVSYADRLRNKGMEPIYMTS